MKIMHLNGETVLLETESANLRGANLQGADLHGANLRGADLLGANLRGANLLGANLRGANLLDADLHGANLRGADLQGANLLGADLRDANLRDANLRDANLRGANLQGADLNLAKGIFSLGCPNNLFSHAWINGGFVSVRVGCQEMRLNEGRKYWAGKENREEVLAALDYAEAVAKLRGWPVTKPEGK